MAEDVVVSSDVLLRGFLTSRDISTLTQKHKIQNNKHTTHNTTFVFQATKINMHSEIHSNTDNSEKHYTDIILASTIECIYIPVYIFLARCQGVAKVYKVLYM